MRHLVSVPVAFVVILLAACAPGTAGPPDASTPAAAAPGRAGVVEAVAVTAGGCATTPPPVVAVVDFANTTAQFGTTVTGVEEAAAARLITLLKESGCYEVVERSVLIDIVSRQGLESLSPEALARAAGAGYVVTGVVTRATIAAPQVALFGVTLGQTGAAVEVDVRVTDIVTGTVLVSLTGAGSASNPNVALHATPVGTVSFHDPTVGPLIAAASSQAVEQAVAAIRAAF